MPMTAPNANVSAVVAVLGYRKSEKAKKVTSLAKTRFFQKEGDGPKSKDKDNNTTITAGEHVEDGTPSQNSTTSSAGASIGAHVLKATGQSSRPTRSVEDLLGAHPINDNIWGGTNPSNVSIDTANSKEVMAGSHIREQYTFKFRGSVQPKLLNMTSYKPHADDLSQNYDLDFLDNFGPT